MSEPTWSKSLPNGTVCSWFYYLAVFNAVFGFAGIIACIYLVSKGFAKPLSIASISIGVIFACINSWFLFLVCDRGLKN